MKFIDARCQIGRRMHPVAGQPVTNEDVLELMDRCGIEKAIAYHAIAKEAGMREGNEELVKETANSDRFIRQWCAMPTTFGEFMTADELFAAMKDHNVTSLRLLPKTQGYSLRPYAIGKIMDNAAQCHVPVFLNLGEELSVEEAYDLCKAYPNVNFVFNNPGYGQNRYLAPVMEQCDNFYLGTANFVGHRSLRIFCNYFDASRLVFDTGLPTGCATAAVSLIALSELSGEERELIAHGNVERLLGEVRL